MFRNPRSKTSKPTLVELDYRIANIQAEQAQLLNEIDDVEAQIASSEEGSNPILQHRHTRLTVRLKACDYEIHHYFAARRAALQQALLTDYRGKLSQNLEHQKLIADRKSRCSALREQLDAAERALKVALLYENASRLQLRQAEKRLLELGIDPDTL